MQGGAFYQLNAKGIVLNVLVRPNAAADKIEGLYDNLLKLRVSAQPLEGAANQAVIKLLSKAFGVPKTAIEIMAGHTGKHKRLQLHLSAEKIGAVLALLETIALG